MEKVAVDLEFWKLKILPKLERFYRECVLPEIVRGNIKQNIPCVDPPYILDAIRRKENKKSAEVAKANRKVAGCS